MQNSERRQEFVLVAVPAELLVAAGIFEGDAMQMGVEGNKLIIESCGGDEDFVCNGDCENCPIGNDDCDGDCENCPCKSECEDSNESGAG